MTEEVKWPLHQSFRCNTKIVKLLEELSYELAYSQSRVLREAVRHYHKSIFEE